MKQTFEICQQLEPPDGHFGRHPGKLHWEVFCRDTHQMCTFEKTGDKKSGQHPVSNLNGWL